MQDYSKFLKYAVVNIIDRKNYDDRKSKVDVEALFQHATQAEDIYIKNMPNKNIKRYIIYIDDLEKLENFYNYFQDLKEQYGECAVLHLKDIKKWEDNEIYKFRNILGI